MKSILTLIIIFFSLNAFSQSQQELKDTVKVPFVYVKTANKAFIEVKTWRRVAGLNQSEMHSKDIEISYYKYADKKCEEAYDTLTQKTIPSLKRKSDDNEKLYYEFKSAYKTEKTQKIALSVTLPVAVALGFIAGFLVGHH